jgi:2,3-bisphosphoglycerate-independent phosphoglycerate mutase
VDVVKNLIEPNDRRILLLVADGLGGLPDASGRTEMETARTPNLDELAKVSSLGLVDPIGSGITPGSGPAHLALFGYDPIEHQVGRGVLEALGSGLRVTDHDLCVRANFCTLDPASGMVTDRRAGRIPTAKNQELVARIVERVKRIEDVEVTLRSGKEHRFVVVFRGEGLSDKLSESDPQHENRAPKPVKALAPAAGKTSRIVGEFIRMAAEVLKPEPAANYLLMRGFSMIPGIEAMSERYGLKAACVAVYPMYRGLAQLVGMEILETGETWESELETVRKRMDEYDFFFVHLKELDKMGEDSNFAGKVQYLEKLDALVPRIRTLGFDVLVITGDHSTPAVLGTHSWHPNPLLLWSPYVRPEGSPGFSERTCARGQLGRMRATEVMPLVLANALKFKKFGA